jgi:(p)ppGpp synthase/HD superfamily hydrolase
MSLVANAEAFARLRHAEQIRKGAASEPYTNHLEEVAELVSRWGGVSKLKLQLHGFTTQLKTVHLLVL